MILECGSCAKMFRVRDDASPHPSKCPTCGGDLRATGGAAAASNPSRVRELETRIQSLERELAESRGGRPTLSVETSPGISGFSAPVAELRAAAEKADRLERELLSLRSESERKLKEKDQELARTQDARERDSAERRKLESHVSGLEDTHGRAIEGKEKTIQALDASIASYRGKVEALQKKLDAVEIQRLSDLSSFDNRLREREQSDRAQLDRATQSQQQALAALRDETEAKIAEKDRQISEGRQSLDREAAERRRLTETLNRLQENANRAVAEKDASLAALEATLSSYKTKHETLQRRVESLEQLRRSEQDQVNRQLRVGQKIRGRIDEASHLAIDLDHSLDSIEASLASLRDRANRLKDTLQETGTEADAVAPLGASVSLVPPAEPEPESAPPALSQAGEWPSAQAEAAVPAEDPQPEPPAEPEAPDFSEVTKTQIKPRGELKTEQVEEERIDAAPASPDPSPSKAEFPEPEPKVFEGRIEAPSGVFSAVEPGPPPAPPASSALEETSDDIPLISPPEEEPPAKPPPPAKKEETKKRFSWQRK